MQIELFGEQLMLSSIFISQPPISVAGKEVNADWNSSILEDIKDAENRITELRDEMQFKREELDRCEIEDYDQDPNPGEVDLYGSGFPEMESECEELEFENETEIRLLELEIAESKEKLKHE